MIIQNAGREGDDHAKRFITDFEKYSEMVTYIKTIMPIDEIESSGDAVGIDDDIKGLTDFYSNRLDGVFEGW